MKKTTQKLLLAAVIMLAVSNNASAQASATATATAIIVTPISLTETAEMNFGNVTVSSSAPGTLVLSAAASGNALRTPTGGVTLPNISGAVTSAEFTVGGEGTYTYAVTMPSSAVTLSSTASGSVPMTIDYFTNDLGTGGATASTGALTGGAQVFHVGATLHVAAGQTAGTYVTGTAFSVTVNYN
jgi:hypothetical protein